MMVILLMFVGLSLVMMGAVGVSKKVSHVGLPVNPEAVAMFFVGLVLLGVAVGLVLLGYL